jgi:hypothetical protein
VLDGFGPFTLFGRKHFGWTMAGALHNTGPWWRSGTPLYRTWNLSRSYVWAVHNGIVGVHTFQVSTARRAPKCLARSFKPEVPQAVLQTSRDSQRESRSHENLFFSTRLDSSRDVSKVLDNARPSRFLDVPERAKNSVGAPPLVLVKKPSQRKHNPRRQPIVRTPGYQTKRSAGGNR